MREHLKFIISGARWSEQYGHHEGTWPAIFLTVVGVMAGLERGPWWWGVIGGLTMGLLVWPFWLFGAWDRGRQLSLETDQAQFP